MFPRLGSSVAQLPVVPVRWTHPQEVSHLDTYTAPWYLQKVGHLYICVMEICQNCYKEQSYFDWSQTMSNWFKLDIYKALLMFDDV